MTAKTALCSGKNSPGFHQLVGPEGDTNIWHCAFCGQEFHCCVWCGEPYKPKRRYGTSFCSQRCRVSHWRWDTRNKHKPSWKQKGQK